MRSDISASLIRLNHQFYRRFGKAFAHTRRRIQPGVARIIKNLPIKGNWLDLGCGSTPLAIEWVQSGHTGLYIGVDFSPDLLKEAKIAVDLWQTHHKEGLSVVDAARTDLKIQFIQADLSAMDWRTSLDGIDFDGIFSFAVLHHLPDSGLRQQFITNARCLLKPGGMLFLSVWQFQHSGRMRSRQLAWETIGIDAKELEPGDTLLDWRFSLPGQEEKTGLRYVHLFERSELILLAKNSGFQVLEEFESDGKEGNLGLYHVWRAE